MLRSLLTAWVLLAATGAGAASELEAVRSQAALAREQMADVRNRQMSLRQELNRVASRIETLKASQHGTFRPGSDLDASLRHSQELSGALSDLARQLSSAEQGAERAHVALLSSLSQTLNELKTRAERSQDREERRKLVTQMHALRAEREQVRAQLPVTTVPALENTSADSPEELLEQADAVRDSEDKVRLRMQQLKTRIQELRDEKDLDTRMNDFLGEAALFDEQDRRLRMSGEFDSRHTAGLATFPQTVGGVGPVSNGITPPTSGGPGTLAPPPAPGVAPGEFAPDSNDVGQLEAQLHQLDTAALDLEQRAQKLESRARELK